VGTFCERCAYSFKSFSNIYDVAPSNVSDNAAEDNTREEMKATAAMTVTAAEVAAPATMISGAPNRQLFLPCGS
jgi:hypothetical protein